MYNIRKATSKDFPRIMEIWESAVMATHDFLKEEDFFYFKKVIPTEYLPNLDVYILEDCFYGKAFMAAHKDNLEMLFVENESRGQGLGKLLLNFAIEHLSVSKVDVNEQNPQALGFYLNIGFKQSGRSEKDASGKHYPIVHLTIKK